MHHPEFTELSKHPISLGTVIRISSGHWLSLLRQSQLFFTVTYNAPFAIILHF